MTNKKNKLQYSNNTISLVVPLFNEYSRGSFDYLKQLTEIQNIDFIFVNDGSTDQTGEALLHFSNFKNATVLNLEKNSGKSTAIQVGINLALENLNCNYVGYLDGDSAFSFDEVKRLSQLATAKLAASTYILLCSSRVDLAGRNIQRSTYRHLIGRVIRTIIDLKHKNLPYDTQSGFKIFLGTDSLRRAFNSPFKTKWFVDLEIILRLRGDNPDLKVWEEPLLEWRDVKNSNISWKSSFTILRDLFLILRLKKTNKF